MHDFVNDQVPPNISDLFSYSSEKQEYKLEDFGGCFQLK